jgi:cation diffusion facilitator CzcD-associated flavoprotein CzcO
MAFPDFPFPSSIPSFVGHADVHNYLAAYAEHFDLLKYIKFKHVVLAVDRITSPNPCWSVRVKNLSTEQTFTQEFDAMFICNGHYSKPYIPSLPGADQFRGLQMHSTVYRAPEQFSKLKVACLGAGPSGIDIALDLCSHAEKVYLCHKNPRLICPLPPNFVQLSAISSLTENGIITDGQEHEVDVLIYCTGYQYDFPFLGPSCGLSSDGLRVRPLYQHMVNIHEPSMFFIGICFIIIPFPFFDTQAEYAASVISGKAKLPSKEEMVEWEKEDYEHRRDVLQMPHKKAHMLGPMQWEYLARLAKLGNFELRVKPWVAKMYDHTREYRVTDLLGYHVINYEVVSDHDFVRHLPQNNGT